MVLYWKGVVNFDKVGHFFFQEMFPLFPNVRVCCFCLSYIIVKIPIDQQLIDKSRKQFVDESIMKIIFSCTSVMCVKLLNLRLCPSLSQIYNINIILVFTHFVPHYQGNSCCYFPSLKWTEIMLSSKCITKHTVNSLGLRQTFKWRPLMVNVFLALKVYRIIVQMISLGGLSGFDKHWLTTNTNPFHFLLLIQKIGHHHPRDKNRLQCLSSYLPKTQLFRWRELIVAAASYVQQMSLNCL